MPTPSGPLPHRARTRNGRGALHILHPQTREHDIRGEETGKNFLNDFTFQYAKARVANKQKNETIEEYRLFNNLLSSHPMAFNLFCPFIQMLQEDRTTEVTRIIQAVFPHIDIHQVTEVALEYLHTDILNYLSDKTAMDAIMNSRAPSTTMPRRTA